MNINNSSIIKSILQLKNIAVVGMSPRKERPSNFVSVYMMNNGYNIIPVNPGQKSIEGQKCYPSLIDIPTKIDVVNIFRKSEYANSITKEAISINVKAIWLQDGVICNKSSQEAKESGLLFIMNDCILRRHRQINI